MTFYVSKLLHWLPIALNYLEIINSVWSKTEFRGTKRYICHEVAFMPIICHVCIRVIRDVPRPPVDILLAILSELKDSHRGKSSSKETKALTKSMNMYISVVGTLNQLFKRGSYTQIKFWKNWSG